MDSTEPRQLSISQLQRLLAHRNAELSKLERVRVKLQKKLAAVEQKMMAVGGSAGERGIAESARIGRVRFRNDKPLKLLVKEILGQHKKGLDLKELTDKVLKSGYKTASGNFSNTVYQAVYNSDSISYDEPSGLYKMK